MVSKILYLDRNAKYQYSKVSDSDISLLTAMCELFSELNKLRTSFSDENQKLAYASQGIYQLSLEEINAIRTKLINQTTEAINTISKRFLPQLEDEQNKLKFVQILNDLSSAIITEKFSVDTLNNFLAMLDKALQDILNDIIENSPYMQAKKAEEEKVLG